jgi:hypothetical protein
MRMSLNNITSAELRKLISIVERKERVQEELTEIESKLSTYLSPEPITPATQSPRRTRKSRAVRVSKPPLEVKVPKPKVRQVESKSAPFSRGPKSGQRRGALKDSILAALQKAGGAGLAIKDLAAALGVKSQNLHVWFSGTGRKVKGVTKVGAGRWKYNGN